MHPEEEAPREGKELKKVSTPFLTERQYKVFIALLSTIIAVFLSYMVFEFIDQYIFIQQ